MKRYLIIVATVALMAMSLKAGAQGRNEFNLFIGGLNGTYTSLDNVGKTVRTDLYSMYEPAYSIHCDPAVTLDYNHKLLNWLGVGVQGNYSYLYGSYKYNVGTRGETQVKQRIISILPQAKFYIPSPRHFRLYGKVGAGVNINFGTSIISDPVSFAWDIVPIGFEWGGQVVYGTAEICVGNVITGGRIGLGFRF